ncbi:MAG: hypothetical protein AAGN35_13195 [Bacteroidota bacterium]
MGFGGSDSKSNFWPLDGDSNEFALRYNREYIINYKEVVDGQEQPRAKAIGGMVGKYFTIKKVEHRQMPTEYLNQDPKAGTTDVV